MKKIFLIIVIFIFFSFLALPKFVFGQYGPNGFCTTDVPCPGGIVPCGRACLDDTNPNNDECAPCSLCHVFILINRVITVFFIPLAIALVGLMAMVGGILFITAAGDPGRITKARQTITGAIVGFIIVLLSWVIVNTIVIIGTENEAEGVGIIFGVKWNEVSCPVP